jgi:hypothetical protein
MISASRAPFGSLGRGARSGAVSEEPRDSGIQCHPSSGGGKIWPGKLHLIGGRSGQSVSGRKARSPYHTGTHNCTTAFVNTPEFSLSIEKKFSAALVCRVYMALG